MVLKDSGNRREFESGAVRDINEGKGRCDLLPLGVIGDMYSTPIFYYIDSYIRTGDKYAIQNAIIEFVGIRYSDLHSALLDVSKHYENGCAKYGARNWEKGIPIHCYIDSGVRHYLKWLRGDEDEPHDRAFLWNMLGALWTHENRPECIDLPFAEDGE